MTPEIIELSEEFLKLAYPVKKVRLRSQKEILKNKKIKGNFRRVIVINDNMIFRMSDSSERYNAMRALSNILIRTFRISEEDSVMLLKKHLRIADSQ